MPANLRSLGRFHMYFAHHYGASIRLAYSDEVTGPWSVHPDPALHMDDTPAWGPQRHIASPDVHVDRALGTLRMYFHAPVPNDYPGLVPQAEPWEPRQETLIATSTDGVAFELLDLGHTVAPPYLRMWPHLRKWHGAAEWFGIAMPGVLVRSPDGLGRFTRGPSVGGPAIRHAAVAATSHRTTVYFTRVGDAPERVLAGQLEVGDPFEAWTMRDVRTELRPTEDWEGADLPAHPSRYGAAEYFENALRDPFWFQADGKEYLFYVAGGEQAIGVVEL